MAFSFHTDFSQRFLVQCIINTSAKMKDKTNKRDPKICVKKIDMIIVCSNSVKQALYIHTCVLHRTYSASQKFGDTF